MATLTRTRVQTDHTLALGVPAPFPRELLDDQPQEDPFVVSQEQHVEEATGSSDLVAVERPEPAMANLLPSIADLEKSCILTLNKLLSGSPQWKSIVPERRHSMPGTSTVDPEPNTSPLETLVSNLRTQQTGDEMAEFRPPSTESDLAFELCERVLKLSPTLSPDDAALANSLATILTYFSRLSALQQPYAASTSTNTPRLTNDAPPPADLYETLTRQLNELQFERPPPSSTEMSILWTQLDRELDNIVAMCKERTDHLPRFFPENLPPQYEYDDGHYDHDFESLPEYDGTGRPSLDHKLERMISPSSRMSDEKMRLDLEGIAMAIDRLYLVAPQLHNQRVELNSSKLRELEKARKEGSRKGKEREKRELENIIEMIGKASERTLKDQSVVLENGMQSRLEKAKMKDIAKRDAFVEGLIQHSAAGRLHGQDATLTPRVKDPQAKLTFPEFMRESIPVDSELLKDPSVMLTLPEFVAQHSPPEDLGNNALEQQQQKGKSKKKGSSRNRSLSAPPLAWLRSRSSSSQGSGTSSPKSKAHEPAFDVVYVAENHDNLQHVLVFFTATGQVPNSDLTAEILPPFPEHVSTGGDHLVIKSGSSASLPLILPARTTPGRKEIQSQRGHYEIKLGTIPGQGATANGSGAGDDASDSIHSPLLDAGKLTSVNPSAFICASCSLPLVQIQCGSAPVSPRASPPAASTGRKVEYRDLPSEHWEELVEAWMCHTDQKLHEQVVKHGKAGFWPGPEQAYVGGSYILFEESLVVSQNLVSGGEDKNNEDWKVRRCLCGAIIGRSTTRADPADDSATTTCFRVLKYAIRPVTLNPSDSLKIPLSAFIVEDMMEYVHAHASYRFVIRDEEDEKPRILIWLFKPRMKLAYTTPRSRAIPKSGSIMAAKVLFKLLRPSDAQVDLKTLLNKYPGFPQAEYLSYPMAICRRIAALLKESNTAYPEGLRTMTGLEVGWLHRR